MSSAGMRLFGRDLDLQETAVTVRARPDDERRVTSGPILGTDAYLTGLDVIECADLNSAVASLTGSIPAEPQGAFLLCGWLGRSPAGADGQRALIDGIEGWRQMTDERGLYVMGSSFGGVEGVGALRFRDARALMNDTPFIEVGGFSACIDVVLGRSTTAAIDLAAAHPVARTDAVEIRRFSD